MFQTIGNLTLLVALLFFGVLALIQAQSPISSDDMRGFLLSSANCTMPCWQGIQPGVTTAEQALALLRANPWVGNVQGSSTQSATGVRSYTNIYWGWNGQQPVFAFNKLAQTPPYLRVRNGIVQYIRIMTSIPYGEAWAIMGAPETKTLSVSIPNVQHLRYYHDAEYFGGRMNVETEINCPIDPYAFWNAPVSITYSDGSIDFDTLPPYDQSHQLYEQSCNA
jgi:hypothetical protein